MRDDRAPQSLGKQLVERQSRGERGCDRLFHGNQVVAGSRTDSSGLVTLKPEQSGPWPMRPRAHRG